MLERRANCTLRFFFPIALLSCFCFSVSAQHTLSGKKFLFITYEIDGNGEWLDFLTDSTCIHSMGSVSWGTNADTLNYTVSKNRISLKGFTLSKGLLENERLTIEYYTQQQIKKDLKLSYRNRSHFIQLDPTENKVMYLRIK
jgi:hypothetical protein